MKKRIISMLLVVCMLVISLASCAYSYDRDDMTNYANFDIGTFYATLQSLKIEDADFGTDEAKRQDKVKDAIITSLAGAADTDTKVTEGKVGENDILYYCYYLTADFDGEPVVFYAAKMKESGATKLQLGTSTLEEYQKKIADAIAGIETFEDINYATDTGANDLTAAASQTVVITYKVSYATEDDGVEKDPVTFTNMLVTLPDAKTGENDSEGNATAASFLEYLIGQKVGSDLDSEEFTEVIDGVTYTASYSGIKIDWVVKEGTALEIKDTTYNVTTEVEDINGTKRDLKDKELTYYVYPVYYIDVVEYSELTASVIFKDLLGSSMKAGGDADEDGEISDSEKGTLDIFTDDGYTITKDDKTVTINALVSELITLLGELEDAEEAVEDAQEKYDTAVSERDKAGDSATTEQKEAVTEAEEALNEAKDKLDGNTEKDITGAKKKVDDKINEILSCEKENGTAANVAIVEDYKAYRYNSLESTYKNAIKNSLAKAIYEAAVECITYKTDENGKFILPEKAVNEAYDRLINNYEYDYYEGSYSSSSSSSKTNYEQYADFIDYLRDELTMKDATSDEVYAAIRKEAENVVKDTVLIYMLKEICDEDVSVTDSDVEEFKKSINYLLLQYQIGADNIKESYYMPGLQLDNIFNYYLEEADKKENDNTIYYKHIKYSFIVAGADKA